MLENITTKDYESPYDAYKRGDLGDELAALQRSCAEKDISVLIFVEGWESSGKGEILNELVRKLDAKHYRVSVFEPYKKLDHYFFTYQLWKNLPAKGDFGIFNRSMYSNLFNHRDLDPDIAEQRIAEVRNFEKLLYDDHTIILKFFLHVSQEEQKEAIKEIEENPFRKFMASERDYHQNKHYDDYFAQVNKILERTNFSFAPWHIVPSHSRKQASKTVLGLSIDLIKKGIQDIEKRREEEASFNAPSYKARSSVEDFDLSPTLSDEEYEEIKDSLQERAGDLAYDLYQANIPTVLAFEGMDAAGKGGAIKRLIRRIDARLFDINPTAAPSDSEKDHQHLWRFYNNFPRDGHIAIFDRSWYGRVMVERVEGFASDFEWSRAYEEIQSMEKELVANDMLVLKFFLMISKEEQADRFEDREEEKPYKITEEDWRNREKWDAYILAIDEMLDKTQSDQAPWFVISGENKKYARIQVLMTFIAKAEEALDQKARREKNKD